MGKIKMVLPILEQTMGMKIEKEGIRLIMR